MQEQNLDKRKRLLPDYAVLPLAFAVLVNLSLIHILPL